MEQCCLAPLQRYMNNIIYIWLCTGDGAADALLDCGNSLRICAPAAPVVLEDLAEAHTGAAHRSCAAHARVQVSVL